jgi:anaerobic magnesium-protoporphyrin IX monomethyl ester cyclase
VPTKYLIGPEVLRFRDEAFKTYFTRSSYLDMIGRKFGFQTADHIREMAAMKLNRKYT